MGYLNKDQGEEVAAIYTKRGDASRPAYSFQNAQGSGMYLQGDAEVGFTVAGIEVLTLGSDGVELFIEGVTSGNLVGTTATQTLTNKTLTAPTLTTPVLGAATGTSVALTGRVREGMSITDLDAQNGTMLAAEILGGIYIHTTVTGAGTVTTDTAANIIAGIPLNANGETIMVHYINDGTLTATFAGGTDVTFSDVGNTVLADTAAIILFRRTTATTCTAHII